LWKRHTSKREWKVWKQKKEGKEAKEGGRRAAPSAFGAPPDQQRVHKMMFPQVLDVPAHDVNALVP